MNIIVKAEIQILSRRLMIESHGITIIRTNPDATDFDINRLISQIYKHIAESIKKQTKNQLKHQLMIFQKYC